MFSPNLRDKSNDLDLLQIGIIQIKNFQFWEEVFKIESLMKWSFSSNKNWSKCNWKIQIAEIHFIYTEILFYKTKR